MSLVPHITLPYPFITHFALHFSRNVGKELIFQGGSYEQYVLPTTNHCSQSLHGLVKVVDCFLEELELMGQ